MDFNEKLQDLRKQKGLTQEELAQKMELSKIPKPFQGLPVALITAGIMAIAFAGLGGMTF